MWSLTNMRTYQGSMEIQTFQNDFGLNLCVVSPTRSQFQRKILEGEIRSYKKRSKYVAFWGQIQSIVRLATE